MGKLMKNSFVAVIILLCISCGQIKAQVPYKASIGGAFPFSNAMGASLKTPLTDNTAFQCDLLYHVTITRYVDDEFHTAFPGIYPAIELNTNIMYQTKIKDKRNSEVYWFMGCGATIGCSIIKVNGKFGANVITGFEYVLDRPLSFQIDIRPGLGILFNSGDKLKPLLTPDTNPWLHFDWMICFTLRRIFKFKEKDETNNTVKF